MIFSESRLSPLITIRPRLVALSDESYIATFLNVSIMALQSMMRTRAPQRQSAGTEQSGAAWQTPWQTLNCESRTFNPIAAQYAVIVRKDKRHVETLGPKEFFQRQEGHVGLR